MTAEGLIDAFTNPMKFASDPNMTADLVMGMTNQVGNEIDEFVTGTLENNLDGVPLDLAALNITRGRDTGVAPLNLVRNQLFAQSGEAQLKRLHRAGWISAATEAHRITGQLHCFLRHACQHHRRHDECRQGGCRAGAGRQRDTRKRHVQSGCLQLPEQQGCVREQQEPMPGPSTTPPASRRSGAPARSPASTRSTCGSAAWPRSRTCSAACSARRSSTSSAPRWKPCRTRTGCTTCRASKACRLRGVAAGQLARAVGPGEHRHQASARQHLHDAGIHDRGEATTSRVNRGWQPMTANGSD